MNLKQIKNEAIATINAAQTMLNRFPDLDVNNASIGGSVSTNPFQMIIEIFKSTAGYNVFLRTIAKVIASALPAVETGVKTVILSNLRNLLSCSFDPIISYDLMEYGIVLPVEDIALMGILNHCPIKAKKLPPAIIEEEIPVDVSPKKGGKNKIVDFIQNPQNVIDSVIKTATTRDESYYYFGCDGFDIPDALENAGDFNAFLWYVKNRAPGRTAWRGVKLIQATFGDSAWEDLRNNTSYFVQKEKTGLSPNPATKDKKSAGIITLDYKDDVTSLKTAEGGSLDMLDVPRNNVLHVLFGNTEARSERAMEAYDRWKGTERLETAKKNELAKAEREKEEIDRKIKNIQRDDKKRNGDKLSDEAKKAIFNKEMQKAEKINEINILKEEIIRYDALSKKYNVQYQYEVNSGSAGTYAPLNCNYYYNRTLVEFNYDYITSLKLFDAKVVLAMLIDSITGCLSIEADFSYERAVIKEETERIVQSIIESDEAVISDCFFRFTNDGYNDMLKKVELMQAGLMSTQKGNADGRVIPNAMEILESIDSISDGASEEEVQSKIETALFKASASFIDETENVETSFNADLNVIDQILNKLAYVLVVTLLSPKLYLLMAVNLNILGKNQSLTPREFITRHSALIKDIIRKIRDILISLINEYIEELIIDLSVGEAKLLAQEQIDYYKRTLRQCIDCFRSNRQNLDFRTDNVNYADIIEDETDSDTKQNSC